MRIWRAVRGEGSELGNRSRARGYSPRPGRGVRARHLARTQKLPPTPCWGGNGLEVRSWGGGGILEDER